MVFKELVKVSAVSAALVALTVLGPGLAFGDEPRPAGDGSCEVVDGDLAYPDPDLTFDHEDHRHWYHRFWTGDCTELGFFDFCHEGEPYWCGTIESVRDRVPAGLWADMRRRLLSLGRLVGFEWARDNDIRKIDTDALADWYRVLEETDPVETAVDRIEREARTKLTAK